MTQMESWPQRPRLFTETFFNLALAIAGAYLLVNVGYIFAVTPLAPGSAIIPHSATIAFFDEHVPAIRWSIARLSEDNDPDSAALVARLFGFAWASGLAGIALQILVAIATFLRAGPEDLRTFRAYFAEVAERQPEHVWSGTLAFGLICLIALVDACFTPYGSGIFSSFRGHKSYDVQKQLDFLFVLAFFGVILLAAIRLVVAWRRPG